MGSSFPLGVFTSSPQVLQTYHCSSLWALVCLFKFEIFTEFSSTVAAWTMLLTRVDSLMYYQFSFTPKSFSLSTAHFAGFSLASALLWLSDTGAFSTLLLWLLFPSRFLFYSSAFRDDAEPTDFLFFFFRLSGLGDFPDRVRLQFCSSSANAFFVSRSHHKGRSRLPHCKALSLLTGAKFLLFLFNWRQVCFLLVQTGPPFMVTELSSMSAYLFLTDTLLWGVGGDKWRKIPKKGYGRKTHICVYECIFWKHTRS